MIWGPAQHQVPDNCQINGIPFVDGQHLREWLRNLDEENVTHSAAKETIDQLKRFRFTARAAENQREQ